MKTRNVFILLTLFTAFFSSCKEFSTSKDALYFTGTEDSPKTTFSIDGPQDMGITITATTKVTQDTKVNLALGTQEELDDYNKKTGKSYLLPPEGSYELASDVATIEKNNYVSDGVRFSIKTLDKFVEGENYCVPVKITGTDGELKVLKASQIMYIVINRTIVSRAVDLHGSSAFNVPKFQTDPRVSALNEITMEIRVRMNSFPGKHANPGISSLMGIEENFLFRFGDISIDNDLLQLAPALVEGKKYYTTGKTHYATGKWYQVVCVYDGSSVAIYVDGKLDVKFSAGPGTINLNDNYFDGFWFGQSCGGRRLNGAISEARFWTKALTMNEIQDHACYVDPTSEGLLGYWRFNAVEDGVVKDETGNGFDAIPQGSYTWIENVRCPF